MGSDITKFSLFELNKLVKETIARSLPESYWVIAEISEINEHTSGHCYLELIQKDEFSDNIKAKARANIWSYTYRMLKPYFETTTNRPLARGMKILVNAQVVFHELYGYSLNIVDIEPSFTMGDIELKKRETISKLIADGIMEMNKELELPLLPKRIAIISSPNAAGFQDFINQLTYNQYGYRFSHELFPSTMQGDDAEKSIIKALSNIHNSIEHFDAVTIVRGGGAQTDLSCFDSYMLASEIAQYPLPVITGIGHDKDVSVVDMVAHTSQKTPTAVAEFLISKFVEAETRAVDLAEQTKELSAQIISNEIEGINNIQLKFQYYSANSILRSSQKLQLLTNTIPHIASKRIENSKDKLHMNQAKIIITTKSLLNSQNIFITNNSTKIRTVVPQVIESEKARQKYWEQTIHNLNPDTIIEKGFSLTYINGKILKSNDEISIGDVIVTKLKKGKVYSNIVKKEP